MRARKWIILCSIGAAAAALAAVWIWSVSMPSGDLYATRQTADFPVEPVAVQTTAETETTAAAATTAATSAQTELTVITKMTETTNITTTAPDRNLNTADAAALKRVSGVGDVLAEAIIAYRTAHGGFTRRAELLEIEGIGEILAGRIMEEFEIPGELPPLTVPAETTATAAQTAAAAETTTTAEEPVGPYDANKVTREELLRIPGMSELYADEILYAREQLHGFRTAYELAAALSIPGPYIQNVLFQYLYVENDTVLGTTSAAAAE